MCRLTAWLHTISPRRALEQTGAAKESVKMFTVFLSCPFEKTLYVPAQVPPSAGQGSGFSQNHVGASPQEARMRHAKLFRIM
jgi:hypothetical protein